MLADAGDDILQRPALGRVIEHVVHGDQRNKRAVGDILQLRQPAAVVAAIKHAGREPDRAAGRRLLETAKHFDQRVGIDPAGGMTMRLRPSSIIQKIRKPEDAVALLGAILAER